MIHRVVTTLSMAALVLISGLLIYATGRPLFADDTWWHLAHGEAYRTYGPWLQSDPLLFAAPGPPLPASWLFDLGLFETWELSGFLGLRVFHIIAVTAILSAAYHLLRRASQSPEFAAFGTAIFAVLSAFRLFQLRPELATIALTLILCGSFIEPISRGRGLRTAATAFALGGIWANLHAGFALAPILLGAATAGMSAASVISPERALEFGGWTRTRDLMIAFAASLAGTLCNPSGYAAYTPYFRAGESTPSLDFVYDEWASLQLFVFPLREISPSPTDWVILWILLVATLATLIAWITSARNAGSRSAALDPALIGVGCVSWIGMFVAVRFLWLAIFPLALIGQWLQAQIGSSPRSASATRAALALSSVVLVPAFLGYGMWPFIARGIPKTLEGYSAPYAIEKHPGHATWFLADADLTGNVFAQYSSGGFLGFWLSPKLRVFANGSLNLEPEKMQAYSALQQRQGRGELSFEATLIQNEVDIFLGAGLPGYHPTRPRPFTTSHLERAEGWVLIFRNVRSSVWLRDSPRNTANFDRVEAYYSRIGISFDPEQGFDIARVLREAPGWSRRQGLSPSNLSALEQALSASRSPRQIGALDRLAQIRASLGQYERALAIDEQLETLRPSDSRATRRQVWSLMHLDRASEARGRSIELVASRRSGLDVHFREIAEQYFDEQDPSQRAAIAATLPLFSRREASLLITGFSKPTARTRREPRLRSALADAPERP